MGVALEDQSDGVLVGDIKKRQRRNRGMDVDRVQASTEQARSGALVWRARGLTAGLARGKLSAECTASFISEV